ncbi:glutathione S-transferase N-terminal domain-containing protein [Candidatus Woesearchaeota archaeon]|nr:glutathione S-transferase N-terminal domain-containing protein [Candidatus Woesearchaeota archaeon]
MAKKKVKKKTKKKAKVIVYSTPTCPWCRKAKEFLKEKKIAFKDYDVSVDEKARDEMIKKSDQMGVPVLDINGTIIVGYDQDAIKAALKK